MTILGLNIFQKKLENSLETKKLRKDIYRIQPYDSIIRGYFCFGFIDFILKGKFLLDYINLFSLNEYEKNNKIILKYFQSLKMLGWETSIVLSVKRILFVIKHYFFLVFITSAQVKIKKYLWNKN